MNSNKQKKQVAEKNFNAIFVGTFVVIILILIAVIVIMLVSKDSNEPEATEGSLPAQSPENLPPDAPIDTTPFNSEINIPELKIESIEDGEKDVVLKTNYCELHYPSMFYDLLKADAYYGDGTGCIIFSANIGNSYATVYTIIFNGEDGISIGNLKIDGVDEPIRVSVNFYDPASNIMGESLEGFYAAQETFNDIIVSLGENDNFTSME